MYITLRSNIASCNDNMTFPLQRGDCLSLFDRLDTDVSNVIDTKKVPDLLRKATVYLTGNTNIEELLIRVSDEFEVSAFPQSQAPNLLWNIHAFSTIPPVTNVLQQRSKIVHVVIENGIRINHEVSPDSTDSRSRSSTRCCERGKYMKLRRQSVSNWIELLYLSIAL